MCFGDMLILLLILLVLVVVRFVMVLMLIFERCLVYVGLML